MTLDDMALSLAPLLSERFRVTMFDRPGHGGSAKVGLTGSCWRQAGAVHDAARALGIERAAVVGHSFGGAVAMAYAMQFPRETAGVVALAPIAFPEPRLEHFIFAPRSVPGAGDLLNAVLAAGVDRALLPLLWRAMFLPQAIPPRFAEVFPFAEAGRPSQIRSEGEDSALLFQGLVANLINYPTCQVPVRVFGGDKDLVVNNTLHGRTVARMLPDGHFTELPGLGHMLHHFAQAPIADALAQLLS